MFTLLPHHYRVPAALIVALAASHACAQGALPDRYQMEPVPGVRLSYERSGTDADAAAIPPGRVDGSVATPVGTLRTTVRAAPSEERAFHRGDTSFELSDRVFGGQVQLRELETGGAAAVWRAKLGDGLAAEARGEQMSARSGQALLLQQDFGDGYLAQTLLSSSTTASAQGSRWDLGVTEAAGLARWNAGVESAERNYVSASGGPEARAGMRLGTQWPVVPYARMEARYTRQVRWDTEEPVSSVMLGAKFDLPRRASLATAVETNADAHHKASVTLTVPLEAR